MAVSGQLRYIKGEGVIWPVVEVSSVVDKEDVTRARERAEPLRKAGYTSIIPVVAGEKIGAGVRAR
ncbi:TPA: hypothetical protein EYP37_13350 [Candidatus Poribacteria bacterium]|nr:hypothetical protein [Candidatus Poribacteria bacterium]